MKHERNYQVFVAVIVLTAIAENSILVDKKNNELTARPQLTGIQAYKKLGNLLTEAQQLILDTLLKLLLRNRY